MSSLPNKVSSRTKQLMNLLLKNNENQVSEVELGLGKQEECNAFTPKEPTNNIQSDYLPITDPLNESLKNILENIVVEDNEVIVYDVNTNTIRCLTDNDVGEVLTDTTSLCSNKDYNNIGPRLEDNLLDVEFEEILDFEGTTDFEDNNQELSIETTKEETSVCCDNPGKPNENKKKRKKFDVSLKERKKLKIEELKSRHSVEENPCNINNLCKRKCSQNINEARREEINKQFWNMSWSERRHYVFTCCQKLDVKRRRIKNTETERRKLSIKYRFKDVNDQEHEVCKKFFLTTLGYKPNNDRFVHYTLTNTSQGNITPPPDRRGKQPSKNKGPQQEIIMHIESFHPIISHYRREHAPNVRYLPSDVNIVLMHGDFLQKFPEYKNRVSYDLYRRIVKEQHISFAQLGHEECEKCEKFSLHDHTKDALDPNCETCVKWEQHHDLVVAARAAYKAFSEDEIEEDTICFSGDMQKIIMLPRVDMFKKVLFIKRLIAYHETFAPVGKKSKMKPHACLWHEGISGRNKEDNVSALYLFLKKHRDVKKIIIWLDNCSSQNKNWCLFTFFVYIINSSDIAAEEIILNYFQPGHSFMSADSFHHQVEQSLKIQRKTYDFEDFVVAVTKANSGNVEVLRMQHFDFFDWPDLATQLKFKKSPYRLYLSDIVHVKATRGEYVLYCKTNYDNMCPYLELDFLQKKAMKGIKLPKSHESPCGFPQEKRDKILESLNEVLPENRKKFWKDLLILQRNE